MATTNTDLIKHLKAACALELWTLPLYLTAKNSIKTDVSITLPDNTTANAGDLIMAVAMEEMYHLELACNMAGGFGVIPVLPFEGLFPAPVYDPAVGIPFVHPNGQPESNVELGDANDLAQLMVDVETPDAGTAPTEPNYGPDGAPLYDSIGDLYSVLRNLIEDNIGDFDGENQLDHDFSYSYKVTTLATEQDILDAITIITDQGEGASGQQKPSEKLPPSDVPTYPGAGDGYSHYERFLLIRDNAEKPVCYGKDGEATTEQSALDSSYTALLKQIQDWPNTSFSAMPSVGSDILAVWQKNACPKFNYKG